ncbi:MAG TPA: ABC transporter permease [Thermoanaerobaculia bacterium]|nr:ABC transporter permease [Thermoanaerobaculia bacterium]
MTLLRVFLSHELRTQLRSPRFHGLAVAYLAVTIAPSVLVRLLAARVTLVIGGATYALALDTIQPLATALVAGFLSVDAIARERDEGSLAVVSLAPVSAAGYVLRRWIALLAILVPLTFIPRVIAFAIAAQSLQRLPAPGPFAGAWLTLVLPIVIIISALALALGTITDRAILAILFGLGIFSVGLGLANDLFAYVHRHVDGAGDLLHIQPQILRAWMWTWRWGDVPLPTEAGYPLAEELDLAVTRSAVPLAIAAILLGLSCSYLRRTRPDVRPWLIRPDHPIRSFLRTLNRIRNEYKPDAKREAAERIALLLGVVIAAAAMAATMRRYDRFERMAETRMGAEGAGPAEMPATIVAASVAVRGAIGDDGAMRSVATVVLRNGGDAPTARLGFALNPGVTIERLAASRGSTIVERAWERVGITIDPPLARSESRTFAFTLRGTPADVRFPFGGNFHSSFLRHFHGRDAVDLTDLSRSHIARRVSDVQLSLDARALAPVPRYTPWTLLRSGLAPEQIAPPSALAIDLQLPVRFTAADSCGTLSSRTFTSRCTFPFAEYRIDGARMNTMSLAPGVRLAHFPAHESAARMHASALAEGAALARTAWPGVRNAEHVVFFERATVLGPPYWMRGGPSIDSTGALAFVPEALLIRRKAIDPEVVAASLVANALRAQRRVVQKEEPFFAAFYRMIAMTRLEGKRTPAVIPPTGVGLPNTTPILDYMYRDDRMRAVFADIEARAGTDRFVAGVTDFLAAGPGAGTAKELLEAIGRRGGIELDRMYGDYFTGTALPRLTLADVTFARSGAAWEARGVLKNERTGEAFCPIVLRTALGSTRVVVRIGANESVPFVLRSEHEPRTLQLDPDRIVYRHAAIGTVDAVDFQGVQ